ncbi:MAG: stage III sporulation protein AF, partial [Lachnospiraceae bacterium]|nr:stage III sporulation protein AF [Lachnospiraceae bacterium]
MELHKVVAQLGIFMICAQTITHFRPKESYHKYLKMLLSIMLLIQIFQPFCSMFFGISSIELQNSVTEFQQVIEERMEEAVQYATLSEERLKRMSLKEVQKILEKQESEGNRETRGNKATEENGFTQENKGTERYGVIEGNGIMQGNGSTEGNGIMQGKGSTEENGIMQGNGSTEGNGIMQGKGSTEENGIIQGKGSTE